MDASPRPTVVVLHGSDRPPGLARLEDRADVRLATAETLPRALAGADVLFAWDARSTGLSRAWGHADALRWVHSAGAGAGPLLFPGLRDSDVMLTTSRGVFDEPMAEYVLGLVLAFAKDLPGALRLQQRRRWHRRETERVAGTRALIVGTGPIGRAIARKLAAVGMSVTGVGRSARALDPDLGEIVPMEGLRAALPDHDYVILSSQLTGETKDLIDANMLRAMRPTARLINIGRDGLVVRTDLIDALDSNALAGAAFAVFADEPLPPSSTLWDMPNVLISPHMTGDVVGWRDELVRRFGDNLDRYVGGLPLLNQIDKRRAAGG